MIGLPTSPWRHGILSQAFSIRASLYLDGSELKVNLQMASRSYNMPCPGSVSWRQRMKI